MINPGLKLWNQEPELIVQCRFLHFSKLVVPVVIRDTLLLLSFANIKRANRCGLLFNVG